MDRTLGICFQKDNHEGKKYSFILYLSKFYMGFYIFYILQKQNQHTCDYLDNSRSIFLEIGSIRLHISYMYQRFYKLYIIVGIFHKSMSQKQGKILTHITVHTFFNENQCNNHLNSSFYTHILLKNNCFNIKNINLYCSMICNYLSDICVQL